MEIFVLPINVYGSESEKPYHTKYCLNLKQILKSSILKRNKKIKYEMKYNMGHKKLSIK